MTSIGPLFLFELFFSSRPFCSDDSTIKIKVIFYFLIQRFFFLKVGNLLRGLVCEHWRISGSLTEVVADFSLFDDDFWGFWYLFWVETCISLLKGLFLRFFLLKTLFWTKFEELKVLYKKILFLEHPKSRFLPDWPKIWDWARIIRHWSTNWGQEMKNLTNFKETKDFLDWSTNSLGLIPW